MTKYTRYGILAVENSFRNRYFTSENLGRLWLRPRRKQKKRFVETVLRQLAATGTNNHV